MFTIDGIAIPEWAITVESQQAWVAGVKASQSGKPASKPASKPARLTSEQLSERRAEINAENSLMGFGRLDEVW